MCDNVFFYFEYSVVCIYAPNDVAGWECFFRDFVQYVGTDRRLVLLKDFNCVFSASDRGKVKIHIAKRAQLLEDTVTEYDLVDVGKPKIRFDSLRYTHFLGSLHARLDRIYISMSISGRALKYGVKPVAFFYLCVVIFRESSQFVWGLWKLDTKLLVDDSLNEAVNQELNKLDKEPLCLFDRSELFIGEIKMIALERSSNIMHQSRIRERSLEEHLKTICQLECEQPVKGIKAIYYIKSQLNEISEERLRSVIVPVRAEKFFFRQETDEKGFLGRNNICFNERDKFFTMRSYR